MTSRFPRDTSPPGNSEQGPGDSLSPEQRSERMSRVRNKNTQLEQEAREILDSLGYKYSLQDNSLPGKPDLVLADGKKVIFIHGCFWHRHEVCHNGTRWPKSKLDFWAPKLEGNKKRDLAEQDQLRLSGWEVLVIWECELQKRKREELINKIQFFIEVGE